MIKRNFYLSRYLQNINLIIKQSKKYKFNYNNLWKLNLKMSKVFS